jgi:NhaP-type Na+/H+ or K+/H+ antiporter
MGPVAVALADARLSRATVALVGWFAPRGLASVVFALLALEDLGSATADRAVAIITITVLLSVIAHGATAEPLANWYATGPAHPSEAHRGPGIPEIPERRLIRRTITGTDDAGRVGKRA